MKKYLLLVGFALCFHQCSTELEPVFNTSSDELTTRAEDLFIEESEKHYNIDPNVITVKLKSGTDKIGEDFKVIRSNKLGYIDLSVPEDIDVEKYVSMLKEREEFETVEFNTIGEYCFTPNDTRRSEQWALGSINAYSAWDITTGSTNVKVAILDSGTDWNHPDLGVGTDGYSNINASLGWNYVTNSSNVITTNEHGTMVAGIVGAKTNNSRGIAGVAGGKGSAGVTMIPYCVGINNPISAVIDDAIINAADKGARVIQMSFIVDQTSAINAAITYAKNKNVVLVCASGNNASSTVGYPASHQDVIAVGSIDRNNNRASLSNYGSALDVVAPGVDILSTALNGSYDSGSGTSYAAPQVSGIAALLLSVNPNLTRQQVINAIITTANRYPNRHNEYGYGLVNAYAATVCVSEPPELTLYCESGDYFAAGYFTDWYTDRMIPHGGSITVHWNVYNRDGNGHTTQIIVDPYDQASADICINEPGSYSVIITVTNPCGMTTTTYKNVEVY